MCIGAAHQVAYGLTFCFGYPKVVLFIVGVGCCKVIVEQVAIAENSFDGRTQKGGVSADAVHNFSVGG